MCGKTLAGFAPKIARVRDSNTNQQTMRDTHTHSGQLFFRGSGYISILWTLDIYEQITTISPHCGIVFDIYGVVLKKIWMI